MISADDLVISSLADSGEPLAGTSLPITLVLWRNPELGCYPEQL
jgi:hypothetical protein